MSALALAAMFFLLLLNGFFVAAEFAFTAASRHELERTPTRASRAALRSIDELSFSLAGAQMGITIASLLLGAVAEPAIASILDGIIDSFVDISESTLHTISFIISLLIVVFLHMVIGEMGPKNVAITDPDRSSRLLAIPFRAIVNVLRPIIWVLNEIANGMLRLFGIDPSDTEEVHTADDLATLITAGQREGVVEDFVHDLLTNALDLGDLHAGEVMVPRIDVISVASTTTAAEIEGIVIEHGYSRLPVYGESQDDLVGFVHAKDLLRLTPDQMQSSTAAELRRSLFAVPESGRVDEVLDEMQAGRNHIAVVIDEHGAMAGIVTLEDIVEEVVGEIRDEHDPLEDGVRRLAPGRYVVDGMLRPAEVRRATNIEVPDGDYDTIGGLVMDGIGRIPEAGDELTADGWSLHVRTMDGRRVGDVILEQRPKDDKPD